MVVLVDGDLRPDELQGDFLVELLVEGPVDPAHAAVAQLLDDLVAAGEKAPCRELLARRLQRFGDPGGSLVRRREGLERERWSRP